MEPHASSSTVRPVKLTEERIFDGGATDFPGHSGDVEDDQTAWSIERFLRRLRIDVRQITDEAIDFDLVGVDASVANALRRCLMAEVPSVAVNIAYIYLNTSLIQDEVLAHRLAFIPLRVPLAFLRARKPGEEATDTTTIVFQLEVRCSHRQDAEEGEDDPEKLYENAHVFSNSLQWVPKGDQETYFQDDPPRPVYDDILIAKLRPGQEVVLELHCELGRGKDHAKWSPVGMASYRLMPIIDIAKPIPPELCETFVKCFPPGVARLIGRGNDMQVEIIDARNDTVSREVLRHPVLKRHVSLGRARDHFIFSVESTGAYAPDQLFPAATDEMLAKIRDTRAAASLLYA